MGARSQPGILAALNAANAFSNQRAVRLFWCGLAGGLLYQTWQWCKDGDLLQHVHPPATRPELQYWPALPPVTVLVAAWNEAEHLAIFTQSFLALRYPYKQLVLVAGGADGSYLIAQRYADLSLCILEQIPGEGKQRALRRGFTHATGTIIYLSDADCRLDDDSFERVIQPLAWGEEKAASGASRPFPEQLTRPFVFSQAAVQLYDAYHLPKYAPGMLGRNCAVDRVLLEGSQGLQAEAPSGTDYIMAKNLVRAGVRLCQIPASQVATAFPITASTYLRQQQRWMRNVAIYGARLGAKAESGAMWRNALVGLGMLLIPLLGIVLGSWLWAVWGVLLTNGWLARLRYARFLTALGVSPVPKGFFAFAPCYLLFDLFTWASVLPGFVKKQARWA